MTNVKKAQKAMSAKRSSLQTLKAKKVAQKRKVFSTKIIGALGLMLVVAITVMGVKHSFNQFASATANVSDCSAIDKSVRVGYPVSGYFFRPSTNLCTTKDMLQPMHQIGADTVVAQGGYVKESTLADLKTPGTPLNNYHKYFATSSTGLQRVQTLPGVKTISRVYYYSARVGVDSTVRKCTNRSGTSQSGSITTTWFLIPSEFTAAYSTCDSPTGAYDLVLFNQPELDIYETTMRVAQEYGMNVYLGLPSVEAAELTGYTDNNRNFQKLNVISQIIMADWAKQYGTNPAFAGIYQSTEAILFQNPNARTLKLYQTQHKTASYTLPAAKRTVLISPFARTVRAEPSPRSLSEITEGAKKIGDTAISSGMNVIIAPQDGAGGGRVGLYSDGEQNAKIRPVALEYVGTKITDPGTANPSLTNSQAYMASTRDVYKAVAAAGYTTWANVEAFNPGTAQATTTSYLYTRTPTDKATFDKQVRNAAPYVSKLISFSWNSTATLAPGQTSSLYSSILQTGKAPILATATYSAGYLNLTGYNLNTGSTSVIVAYLDYNDPAKENKILRIKTPAANFQINSGSRMQSSKVPVADVAAGMMVRVQVQNSAGDRTNAISFKVK